MQNPPRELMDGGATRMFNKLFTANTTFSRAHISLFHRQSRESKPQNPRVSPGVLSAVTMRVLFCCMATLMVALDIKAVSATSCPGCGDCTLDLPCCSSGEVVRDWCGCCYTDCAKVGCQCFAHADSGTTHQLHFSTL